jgi:integrase
MARKTDQIIRRGPETRMVRIYVGRDPETGKRQYVGKCIHGGLRAAQAHLNKMLAERDLGRNIRSFRQTLGQYLDHWLDICARPRLRAKISAWHLSFVLASTI